MTLASGTVVQEPMNRGKILLQDIPQGAEAWAGLSKLKGKQPGPCCRGAVGEQLN